jgi:FimV-like protein
MDCQRVREDDIALAYLRGELGEADREAFEQHYFECGDCFDHLETLRTLVDVLRQEQEATGASGSSARPARRAGPPAVWSWAWAAALVFVAVTTTVVLRQMRPFEPSATPTPPVGRPSPTPAGPPTPERPSLQTLAHVEPPPYAPLRLRGGSEAPIAFDRAMERYGRGDYPGAAAGLRAALRAEPASPEARFYLGVSELLAGRPDAAMTELKTVAQSHDEAFVEPARYYLAKAHLARGDAASARVELEVLARGDGDHKEEARRLLSDLGTEP